MEKRLLLALVLSIGVVLIFSQFTSAPPETEKPATEQSKPATASNDTGTATPSVGSELVEAKPKSTSSPSSPEVTTSPENPDLGDDVDVVENAGETVPFETDKLRGSISRRGGHFQSIKLKNYGEVDNETKPVDLVAPGGAGFSFQNRYPNSQMSGTLYQLLKPREDGELRFRTRVGPLEVTKTYRFDEDRNYQLSLELSLRNRSNQPLDLNKIDYPVGQQGQGAFGLRWGPGFGVNQSSKNRLDQTYIYYGKNGEMNYQSPGGGGGIWSWFSGGEDKPYHFERGPVEWIGISSRYFIATLIPQNRFDMLYIDSRNGADTFTAWGSYAPIELGSGEQRTYQFDLFLGPKEYNRLNNVQPGLEATMNYGWFTFISRPLLWSLNFIYSFIPNYGIAIILLSILIKVLLYPLTKKGLVSMQRMRQLQPELKKLQEKYEDDKEKLNQKMMEFYQENDLNPLGGCLPMLLQLPIFVALYRMLEYSIELRGAHFMLWVTDLSHKDPYYILPVVMGIIMFFQQKYTMTASPMGGTTGQQQKLMVYFMPVMFVFLFMNFPVGLVLYWMTNSLMTLIQYALIYRSLEEG